MVTLLSGKNSMSAQILQIEAELLINGTELINEGVYTFKMLLADVMKVKEFISDPGEAVISDVPFIFLSDKLLGLLRNTHEINAQTIQIVLPYHFKVFNVGCLGEVVAARDFSLCCESPLSPKDWYAASDLEMRGAIIIVIHDLLHFIVVGNVAIVIDTSRVEASACLFT